MRDGPPPREIATAAWSLLDSDSAAITIIFLYVDSGQKVAGYWALSVPESELVPE